MKPIEVEFKAERIGASQKVSKEYLTNIEARAGISEDDVFRDLFTYSLQGYILTNLEQQRTLTYYTPKPKFLDWFFGRVRKVEWKLDVKDVLLNPPALPERTDRIYIPTMTSDEVVKRKK